MESRRIRSDLHAHDCINLRKITSGTVDRWRFVENGKDLEIAVEGHIVTNDGAVLVDAALDGLGLAYVFENMVREARGREAPRARARQVLPADSGLLPLLSKPSEPRAQAEGASRLPQEQWKPTWPSEWRWRVTHEKTCLGRRIGAWERVNRLHRALPNPGENPETLRIR